MDIEIEVGRDRRTQVRWPYTEAATWREAVGNHVTLLFACTYGPLDTPDQFPAGAMRASKHGPYNATAHRGD